MRRKLLVMGTAFALAVMANPADAQMKFGIQGGVITGLDELTSGTVSYNTINGTKGIGGRVMLDPPLFPVGVIGSATYYLVDEGDPGYWTGTIAAQLRLPLPIVKPYVLAGWQVRNTEGADGASGAVIGAGVQLSFALSVFLEGTFELDEDIQVSPTRVLSTNRVVIKGGVLIG